MVFVRPLSDVERRALKQGVRHEVGRVSERMRAILLSGRGYAVPEIARVVECDEATVREWIARFEATGVPGLRDRPRAGRPPRAGAAARERLRRAVTGGPASVGPAGGVWTVVTLRLYLFVTEQVAVSGAVGEHPNSALRGSWWSSALSLEAVRLDPSGGTEHALSQKRVLGAA